MSQSQAATGSVGGAMLTSVGVLARVLALLVVELIISMLVYIYLALYNLELFGSLVRVARDVLNVMISQFEYFFPAQTNTAYATLLGELGPKSILLLLIGLTVGAVIRLIGWALTRMIWGR